MITDELMFIFLQVAGVYMSGLIGFLGIVLNITNIFVLIKLGFSESTNISLLALAVADIGVSFPMLSYSIVNFPYITSLLGEPLKVAVLSFNGSVQITFYRIAGLLTAFLALERFICVAWPLHVKTLVTSKLTVCVVISIASVMMSCNVPFVLANPIGPIFDQLLNDTVMGIAWNHNSQYLQDTTISIQLLAQMTSFIVVTVSTLGLIRSLRKISEWRNSTSSVGHTDHVSRREKQLVKMVILISTIFIVCSLPTVVGNFVMVFVKDFNPRGTNRNLYLMLCLIFVILSSINSMINIFVYLNMSSRYRKTFNFLVKR